MHAYHYTRSMQARQNAKVPTCSPIDPTYYNQKEEGPMYAIAEVGARNRTDLRMYRMRVQRVLKGTGQRVVPAGNGAPG